MGKALYRKYRSKDLSEIVGQPHITTTLSNALDNKQISHAYLFTGPRGTGKTSIARILAHSVNGLDYGDETSPQHLDIIEIDAASNRRIDEIRELRDKVHVAPSTAKYKVYIIDEAHMLTKEAFNALLKTLEEPPEHVIFILATTEAHKLPETIISRTQRFTFKPVPKSDIINHLQHIANREKIKISDEALNEIAEHGRGSFRDSISLLDQMSTASAEVTKEKVLESLGIAPTELVDSVMRSIETSDVTGLMSILKQSRDQGIEPQLFASAISEKLRHGIHNQKLVIPVNEAMFLIKELIEVPRSSSPDIALELALLRPTFNQDFYKKESKKTTNKKIIDPIKETDETIVQQEKTEKEGLQRSKKPSVATDAKKIWKETLLQLRGNHNTLYGIARMAEPNMENNVLTLSFKFDFHKRRCSEKRNQAIISEILNDLSSTSIELAFATSNTAKPITIEPAKNQSSGTLDSITDVFGGGEILDT